MYSHHNYDLVSKQADRVSDNHKKSNCWLFSVYVKFADCHVSFSFLGFHLENSSMKMVK